MRREEFDRRWVPCRRPFIVTGGELTLEMLDLSFNAQAKFYEAPLHIKALGGTFVIDDFGRQIVSPEALLNRWIVPLESRVEYLKLHTGKSFSLPFDELVIFSTNLAPSDLMDPAFLRRIPYKLEVTVAESRRIPRDIPRWSRRRVGIEASDEIIDFVIAELRERNDFPLAGFQPKFIIDQVRAACKFEGIPAQFRPEFIPWRWATCTRRTRPASACRAGEWRRSSRPAASPSPPYARRDAHAAVLPALLLDLRHRDAADLAGARDMRAAAGLQVDAARSRPAERGRCPIGGLTDMVLTRPGLAASSSSVIQRVAHRGVGGDQRVEPLGDLRLVERRRRRSRNRAGPRRRRPSRRSPDRAARRSADAAPVWARMRS